VFEVSEESSVKANVPSVVNVEILQRFITIYNERYPEKTAMTVVQTLY
jgi:hypothetical protein